MPKPNNPLTPFDLPPSKTIFIDRKALGLVMAVSTPTESQKEILRLSIVKKWPAVYEMTRSKLVTDTLTEIKVSWRDKK